MRRRNSNQRRPKRSPLGPLQTYFIDGLTHEAKGVARLDGKVTFIDGALPGETVMAQVNKLGRRFDEAILREVITPSEQRVEPLCRHFNQCGGCSFQHLEMSAQRQAKHQWLAGQLRHLCSAEDIEQLYAEADGYRRRARISVSHKDSNLVMGFRGKSSNQVIDITSCQVLTPKLQQVFHALKDMLAETKIFSTLGHVELLLDSKGVSLVLRLIKILPLELRQQCESWAAQQKVDLYWQAPNESKAEVSTQQMRYYELSGLRLFYHPQDFIQVNDKMNQKMVEQAISWLAPTQEDVVLDLFCGVGNFSLPLAQGAGKVIGVELLQSMVDSAKHNADYNALKNVSFLSADLTQAPPRALQHEKITKVLLDPPRAGAFEFLDTMIKMAPKQILYVSCNASTLARDAEYLVANGYQVIKTGLMDMFPQTSHVETMMLLQSKK
ncbi:23S rRNA (uracil(1939)-C(5))-methyltransferase RlmD [Marinomonas sp. THO17]|uniref:23S rRNA (uracil(1939)-C(5))-methyltransferase RlmD n=1 Tax=Marinomonas sp. THO17 TaxID=3149048 RepID=UPI00336BF305